MTVQKVPYGDTENAVCDQYKAEDEKVKGGLRGSPKAPVYH